MIAKSAEPPAGQCGVSRPPISHDQISCAATSGDAAAPIHETMLNERNIAMNTSVIEAIERQKTTNLYDASKSLPDDEIRELVRLATFSPTAFHLQNWRFIAVRSPEAKARLRAVAADQPKVTEAAVTFIMVGELSVADVMADRLAGLVAARFWARLDVS